MDESAVENELIGKIKKIIIENKYCAVLNILISVILIGLYHLSLVTLKEEKVVKENQNKIEFSEVKNIIVEMSGAVTSPGIYEVEEGTRVGEAIVQAGGVTQDADMQYLQTSINQSQKVKDAEKIYIPYLWDSKVRTQLNALVRDPVPVANTDDDTSDEVIVEEPSESQLVDINIGNKDELDVLPGIGPAYAQKIIDNRPYKDFAEFSEKSGLSDGVVSKLKGLISF